MLHLVNRCRNGPAYRHDAPASTARKAAQNVCPAASGSPVVTKSTGSTLWTCLGLIPLQLILQGGALADEAVGYSVGAQSEVIQALGGALYLALVAYFFYRIFTGRASRFTSGRVGASEDAKPVEDDPYLSEPVPVSPLKAFLSASQALAIAAVLYFLASTVDNAISTVELPDQLTVRNIAVTLRTIVTGLAYLATFIFGANGVGLAALSVKLALYGDDEASESAKQKITPAENVASDRVPDVGLLSHPDDVMRALDEVSDLSRYRKDKTKA